MQADCQHKKTKRTIIEERERKSTWREKRSTDAWSTSKNKSTNHGKKSVKSRITSSVNGNMFE